MLANSFLLRNLRPPFDKAQGERKRFKIIGDIPFMLIKMSKHEEPLLQ